MALIQLTDDVLVNPDDVSSIQREVINEYTSPSISDNSMMCTFDGSIVTLKSGRKIAVRGLTPKEIEMRLGFVIDLSITPKQIQEATNEQG